MTKEQQWSGSQLSNFMCPIFLYAIFHMKGNYLLKTHSTAHAVQVNDQNVRLAILSHMKPQYLIKTSPKGQCCLMLSCSSGDGVQNKMLP